MGFANLSIAEIAADYDTSVPEVLQLCDRLGISYKNPQTRLALEDAKAIISEIMAHRQSASTDHQEDSQAANSDRDPQVGAAHPSVGFGPESSNQTRS